MGHAQTIQSLNAPFVSISQTTVTYGQGVVADAENNLYITGTVNLIYLPRNPDGSYSTVYSSSKIDSTGGTAYELAIDPSNNLYRPDIARSSNPNVAIYIYEGTNSFTKTSLTATSFS